MKNKGIMLIGLLIVFCLVCCVSGATSSSSTSETAPTNVVVDFDSTVVSSNLRPGDGGVLNLVVKNTGGHRAENIEVSIPSTAIILTSKKFDIGRLDAGASKTIPVTLRIDGDAKTGLTAIQVQISFDGFDSDGDRDNDQLTKWEIPLTIYGNPSFQATPSETTYYKDTLDELKLDVFTMDSVKALEATLSSSCITVIGSSRKYVGNVNANKTFELTYPIKPSAAGACTTYLILEYTDESGSSVSDNISIGLNIEAAGVDFKVVNISYETTGPGEIVTLNVGLKNVGKASSDDTTVSLTLDTPFVPVDTAEKYIGTVEAGETVYTTFDISVGWDADIQAYAIPLTVDYKVGGTSYSVEKDIGLDVSGKVILEIISVDQSRGSLQIEVANMGTRAAESVKATVKVLGGENRTQGMAEEERQAIEADQETSTGGQRSGRGSNPLSFMSGGGGPPGGMQMQQSSGSASGSIAGEGEDMVSYKSDIKTTKQTTFTFDSTVSGPFMLIIEYSGPNNERVAQTENFNLGGSTSMTANFASMKSSGGSSILWTVLKVVAVVLLVFAAYKLYKRRKTKQE